MKTGTSFAWFNLSVSIPAINHWPSSFASYELIRNGVKKKHTCPPDLTRHLANLPLLLPAPSSLPQRTLWYVEHILIVSKQEFTQVYTSASKQSRGALVETCKWPSEQCWWKNAGRDQCTLEMAAFHLSLSLSLFLINWHPRWCTIQCTVRQND